MLWPQEEPEAATSRNSTGVVGPTAYYQEITAPSFLRNHPDTKEIDNAFENQKNIYLLLDNFYFFFFFFFFFGLFCFISNYFSSYYYYVTIIPFVVNSFVLFHSPSLCPESFFLYPPRVHSVVRQHHPPFFHRF